jgi:GAF domain-containing protein/HAMP domain-containing protein
MWNSLRFRFTLILIGLAIGPLLLAGSILAQRTYSVVRDQALTLQIQVSQNVSLEVEKFFQDVVGDLGSIGDEIQSLNEPDRAQLLSVMLSAIGSGPYQNVYNELTLLDEQGLEQVRVSRDEIVSTDQLKDYSNSDEFKQPATTRDIFYSPVVIDPNTGNAFITIAIPLYEPRSVQLIGVLVADLRFSTVGDVIAQVPVGQSQTVYLTNASGELLAHQDRTIKLQGTRIALPQQADMQTGLNNTNVALGVSKFQLGEQEFNIVAERPTSDALALANSTINTLLIIMLVALGIAGILGILSVRQVVLPIEGLASTAKLITAGDFTQRAKIERRDEIGTLADTFNGMTSQLQDLIGSLELRVQDRTAELEKASAYSERRARQFEAVTRVSRAIASTRNLQELLPQITEVISEQFGFYHVGIFLNDANRQYAGLSAANSPGGKRMLARGHQLKIGEQGIVGYVTGTGKPRIALDVGEDAVFFNNPDLPNTRSEMALPMVIAGNIAGALDVQSTEPNAFTADDIDVLTILTDQVSLAIQNARLFEQTQRSLNEAETMYRQYLRDTWAQLPQEQNLTGFRYSVSGAIPLEGTAKQDQPASETKSNGSHRQEVSVPVILRGEKIGLLSVQIPDQGRIRSDQMDLIKAVAERVALSVENARLFEETTKRAERERLVSDITTKIRGTNDPDEMIRTAIEELQQALGATRVEIVPQQSSFHSDQ